MAFIISDGQVKGGIGKASGKPYMVQVCALDDGGLGAERFERFVNERDPRIEPGKYELPAGVRAYVREGRLCFALDVVKLKRVEVGGPVSVAAPDKPAVNFGARAVGS